MLKFINQIFLAFLILLLISISPRTFAEENKVMPCSDNEKYHQFDFWLGNWDVYDDKGTKQGSNIIEKIYDGCLITESWTSVNNTPGFSTNYYNPVTDKWAQRWVSAGSIIEYEGGLKKGSMILEGKIYYHKSKLSAPFRGTWTLLEDGRVRQFFEQYKAKDKKWNVWFEGFYVKSDSPK